MKDRKNNIWCHMKIELKVPIRAQLQEELSAKPDRGKALLQGQEQMETLPKEMKLV